MTTGNRDDAAVLANLDNLAMGLDKKLDDLSRIICTMAGQGQCTDNPLSLYRAIVEIANHAKTLHSQKTEAMHIGAAQA